MTNFHIYALELASCSP